MDKKMEEFQGRHWETGSIHNALAIQKVKAAYTGRPFFVGKYKQRMKSDIISGEIP